MLHVALPLDLPYLLLHACQLVARIGHRLPAFQLGNFLLDALDVAQSFFFRLVFGKDGRVFLPKADECLAAVVGRDGFFCGEVTKLVHFFEVLLFCLDGLLLFLVVAFFCLADALRLRLE